MKAYKITLFIFCIIGLLAVVCISFPSAGLQVGHVKLEFPSLEDVLGSAEQDTVDLVPQESPEELLARRLAEMRMQEEEQYLDYFQTNAARIQFPDDSLELFDNLFRALDEAGTKPLRIVHYGDSQIEEDRITSTLREELQQHFGGNGVGLVPLMQSIPTLSIGHKCEPAPRRQLVYGTQEMRRPDDLYGVMGQVAQIDTMTVVRFYPLKKVADTVPARYFNRLTVLVGNVSRPLTVTCGTQTQTLDTTSGQKMERLLFSLPDSTVRNEIYLSGAADVYGLLLDGTHGVSVDNIPMRGCSGTVFTQMNAQQLADYYARENVRLIILQFGGNSVPYLTRPNTISAYGQQITRQIRTLKRLAPQAEVLFIGPSDMATKVKSDMQTYPYLPMVIDTLKSAVHQAGAAYWDLYEVMGGRNSMVQWVNAQPPLAASDYVHFSHAGAERVGDMLCKSLMLYYDYYKWRADTVAVAADTQLIDDTLSFLP